MRMRPRADRPLEAVGLATVRYGMVLNLLSIVLRIRKRRGGAEKMPEKNRKPGPGGEPGRRWLLVRRAQRHPFISAVAAFIGVGLIIFALVFYQPQKLFLNKTVNEPVPGVIQTAPTGNPNHNATAGGSPPPVLQPLSAGSFRSLEHATTGTAIVLRRPDRRLILRRGS